MGNLVILEGVSSLSVKIGIGYGKCALLYVGGVFNRAEFFTVGEALKLALAAQKPAVLKPVVKRSVFGLPQLRQPLPHQITFGARKFD